MIYGVLMPVGWLIFLGAFLISPIRERLSSAKQVCAKGCQSALETPPKIVLIWDDLLSF